MAKDSKKEVKVVKKYKATEKFDVDAFNDFEGLGNAKHTLLSRGEVVELEEAPKKLIDNKMIEQVGGK
jgi:hypothetical protein